METIVAAIITAVTSIIVAIIQIVATQKQTKILQQQEWRAQPGAKSAVTEYPVAELGLLRQNFQYWIFVGALIAIYGFAVNYYYVNYNLFIAAPIISIIVPLFLAYKYPIPWGFAAVIIGFLHLAMYLGWHLGVDKFGNPNSLSSGDIKYAVAFYIVETIIISLICSLCYRKIAYYNK